MNTNKKKLTGFLVAILLLILILVIVLYVVPFAQMASYRGSETVQAHAAQLAADYEAKTGETISQEDVCRDMSYLHRYLMYSDLLPTEIAGTHEGRLVYVMPITDTKTESVDVFRSSGGTIHYFIQSEDGQAQNNVELKPWGTIYVDGSKA